MAMEKLWKKLKYIIILPHYFFISNLSCDVVSCDTCNNSIVFSYMKQEWFCLLMDIRYIIWFVLLDIYIPSILKLP